MAVHSSKALYRSKALHPSKAQRRLTLGAALIVCAAGTGVAAADGATATSPAVSSAVFAYINRSQGMTVLEPTSRISRVSARNALSTAMARLNPGSKVMGETLAREYAPWTLPNQPQRLVWLVSVNAVGGPMRPSAARRLAFTFDVLVVDAETGKYLGNIDGAVPGMAPLPLLPGK